MFSLQINGSCYIREIGGMKSLDFEITNGSSFSLMVMRKQRIQFSGLSDNQRSRLSEFIKNNSSTNDFLEHK